MAGPRGSWLLGSISEYNADPLAFVANAVRDHGDFVPLRLGLFFPFGMGPRMCIGAAFANLELMLALPMIGRRYRFEPSSTDVPKPVPRITLNPDRPIRLRLQ